MNNYRSDLQKKLSNKFVNMFFINAFADGEINTSQETGSISSTIDIAKLMEQTRKEEKDKLYPEIQRLKSENSILQKQLNDALLDAGKVKQEIEVLKKSQSDSTSSEITKLQAKIEALMEENKKLKESTPNEEDIRKKIEKEFEVKSYLKDKLAENKDKILSVYAKQVKGSTKEEIDNSIEEAIKNSDEIRKEVNGSKPEKQNKENTSIKNSNKSGNRKPEIPPATNPSINVGNKEYSLEYIQGLDPSSKEYAEFRKSVGLKIR